jgi:hypothetical protein
MEERLRHKADLIVRPDLLASERRREAYWVAYSLAAAVADRSVDGEPLGAWRYAC